MEGPFFAERYKGAHLPENIRNTKLDEFCIYLDVSGGWVKLITMSPELEDACMMASENPALTVGIYDKMGSITVGKIADIVILNKDLSIKNVILRGNLI